MNNTVTFESVSHLRRWLVEAKEAHAVYEAHNGPDANWPQWYAEYIFFNAMPSCEAPRADQAAVDAKVAARAAEVTPDLSNFDHSGFAGSWRH